MSKIETICPQCQRNARTVKTMESTMFGGSVRILLNCGHSIIRKNVKESNVLTERDELFEKLYPFQKEGVEFIERANFKALIADDMGLGKTIQALMAIRYHREELSPVLYITKSAVKYQWQKQIMTWLHAENIFDAVAQTIENGNSTILPGIKHVIISMDMLDKLKDDIIKYKFRTIVIDESQNFKTIDSNRTKALFEIVREMVPKGIICLTGTPVLNRASEYFTTLNLLRPEQWRSYDGFVGQWIGYNRAGTNHGGISSYRQRQFHELTKPYILRREKRDVLKDLPPFRRNFEWITIEDERLKNAYNSQLKELQKHLKTIESLRNQASQQMEVLGYLEKLRQITALSKIPWVVDYVNEFLETEETAKIVIGLHHKLAIDYLTEALNEFTKVITLTGDDSAQRKEEKKEAFIKDPKIRVINASILAAGEGLDGLQHAASDMLTLERMWNLSKERQFEARLDRHGQTNPVTNTLLLAKGTVDEYFTEVVLEKEEYVMSAVERDRDKIEQTMQSHASNLNYIDLAKKCVRNFI